MSPYTLFLRTALFHVGGPEAHVPTGVFIIRGDITSRDNGMITVKTAQLLDDRGNVLSEEVLSLSLPTSKIDHVHNHE